METLRIKEDGGFYGVVGKNNTIVVPFEYDEIIRTFSSGLINVCKDDKWGCLDLEGNMVIPLMYDWIFPFGKDAMDSTGAKRNGKWGIIDRKGNDIIPCVYDNEIVFKKDIAVVSIDGKTGMIDKEGKAIVPCQYSYFKPFILSPKLIKIMESNKWGIIDEKGNTVIPPTYDGFDEIYNDFVVVKQEGRYGLVNLRGEIIIPIEYNKIDKSCHNSSCFCVDPKSEIFAVYINKKWQYIIANNDNRNNTRYDWVSGPWRNGEYIVKIDKNFGIVNRLGEMIVPMTYSKIYVDFDRVNYNQQYVLKARGNKSTTIPF